jgi:hypothetical protein
MGRKINGGGAGAGAKEESNHKGRTENVNAATNKLLYSCSIASSTPGPSHKKARRSRRPAESPTKKDTAKLKGTAARKQHGAMADVLRQVDRVMYGKKQLSARRQ